MKSKVFLIRSARKSSHITGKIFRRGLHLSNKIEDKATKILTGVDFSMSVFEQVPFEKVFYKGIPHNITPLNPALPSVGRKGAVVLLIPSLNKGSFYGGTATALRIAGKLASASGLSLRIVETLEPGGKAGLGDFFSANNIPLDESAVELIDVSARTYNIYGYIDIHPDDIFMASAWWDAHLLDKLPLNRKYIYLLQDFEPIFYANSDEYILAENTYRSEKFIPVCNTKLMYTFLSQRYQYIKDNALWFEPAVGLMRHGYSTENKQKRKLFLYGRPNVERNLFYSGLNALNIAFESRLLDPNEWELYMAGQDNIPNIRLSSGIEIKNKGKMSLGDYYNFAKSIDVTLSLMMAPHPNYPTLELASIGSAVVTTKYETKQDLSFYSKNIFMADLTTQSIVDTISQAAALSYQTRLKNARASTISEDWDQALEATITTLKKEATKKSRSPKA